MWPGDAVEAASIDGGWPPRSQLQLVRPTSMGREGRRMGARATGGYRDVVIKCAWRERFPGRSSQGLGCDHSGRHSDSGDMTRDLCHFAEAPLPSYRLWSGPLSFVGWWSCWRPGSPSGRQTGRIRQLGLSGSEKEPVVRDRIQKWKCGVAVRARLYDVLRAPVDPGAVLCRQYRTASRKGPRNPGTGPRPWVQNPRLREGRGFQATLTDVESLSPLLSVQVSLNSSPFLPA